MVAFPFGLLLAWLAMSTPHSWRQPPEAAWMERARAEANDRVALEALARQVLELPVEIAGVAVDSTDGMLWKVSGEWGLQRRPPSVRLTVGFAIGPRPPLRLAMSREGNLEPIETLPDTTAIVVSPEAVQRLYPQTTLVEFGGSGPFPPGSVMLLRLMEAEDDWSFVTAKLLADGKPWVELARMSRDEVASAITRVLAARGERALRITTYFQPAGRRVMYMAGPAFDFEVRLPARGFATIRAALVGEEVEFEVISVRR